MATDSQQDAQQATGTGQSSPHGAGELTPTGRGTKRKPHHVLRSQTDSQRIADPTAKITDKQGGRLPDGGFGHDFLDMTPTEKLSFIQIKNVCVSKDTISQRFSTFWMPGPSHTAPHVVGTPTIE